VKSYRGTKIADTTARRIPHDFDRRIADTKADTILSSLPKKPLRYIHFKHRIADTTTARRGNALVAPCGSYRIASLPRGTIRDTILILHGLASFRES